MSDAPETASSPPAPAPAPPPVEKLGREALAYLIEICVPPKEILTAFKQLGVHAPGYRLDKLPHADLAAMYAEEALEAEDALTRVRGEVVRALGGPSFADVPLTPVVVKELVAVLREDPVGEAARLCWRLLVDPDPALAALAPEAAALAIDVLDAFVKARGDDQKKPAPKVKPSEAVRRAEELAARLARALNDADRVREQLKAARAELAQVERRLGEERRAADAAREEAQAARAEIARLREAGGEKGLAAEADARRLSDENRSLRRKLEEAEAAGAEAEERMRGLTVDLAKAREQLALSRSGGVQPVESQGTEGDDAPDWVVPSFTREFYDSLKGWDRRLQRAAFEKAMLLARDRRHPSLRALALEGIEGYYRIRVATDVRLIYRRGEGGAVEVLSLIDREDLDRYVRQAKTRQG